MAVLAMLKLSNHNDYLHLHAPAQSIMPPPPEQHRYHLSLNMQTVDWTAASELNECFNRREKNVLTESLKRQQQQNPQNLTEAKITFVRAGKTATRVSSAEEKQFQLKA